MLWVNWILASAYSRVAVFHISCYSGCHANGEEELHPEHAAALLPFTSEWLYFFLKPRVICSFTEQFYVALEYPVWTGHWLEEKAKEGFLVGTEEAKYCFLVGNVKGKTSFQFCTGLAIRAQHDPAILRRTVGKSAQQCAPLRLVPQPLWTPCWPIQRCWTSQV